MGRRNLTIAIIAVSLALAAVGCARVKPTVSSEPFIFRAGEFDRTRSDYGREPKTISEVRVCYRRDKATPEQVGAMAREECGRFGKTPVFIATEYLNCPLLTPAEAFYRCLGPGENLTPDERDRVARLKARL